MTHYVGIISNWAKIWKFCKFQNLLFGQKWHFHPKFYFISLAKMILNDSWNFNLITKLTSEAHDKKVVSFFKQP